MCGVWPARRPEKISIGVCARACAPIWLQSSGKGKGTRKNLESKEKEGGIRHSEKPRKIDAKEEKEERRTEDNQKGESQKTKRGGKTNYEIKQKTSENLKNTNKKHRGQPRVLIVA